MRKTRFLAFILTFAMLLSTFVAVIPVTAATTLVSNNVTGSTINIDGVIDPNEGWPTEADPALTLSGYTSGDVTTIQTNATVKNPSTFKITNDGEYVYLLYETAQYAPLGLTFYILFNGDAYGTEDTTALYRIYNHSTDYTWDGATDSFNNSASTSGRVGYIYYKSGTNYATTDPMYVGTKVVNKQTTGNGRIMEMRVPIPEDVKTQLECHGNVSIQFSAWEKYDGNDTSKKAIDTSLGNYAYLTEAESETNKLAAPINNAGFIMPCKYGWSGQNTTTVALDSDFVSSTLPITFDGKATDGEIWKDIPQTPELTLSKYTTSGTSTAAAATTPTENDSFIKIANDNKYVYIYYQAKILPRNMAYFQLSFDGADRSSEDGNWVQVALWVDKQRGVNGSTATGTGGGLGQLWYAYETNYADGSPMWEGFKMYIDRPEEAYYDPDGEATKYGTQWNVATPEGDMSCSAEIRIPIPADTREKLATGQDVQIGIAAWDKYGREADRVTTITGATGNEGYNLPGGYAFDGTVTTPVTLKSTAKYELPTVKNVLGKNIMTIDAQKGTNEGWATIPYTLLDSKRTSANTASTDYVLAEKAAKVYLSTDGEYLYIFYESTNTDGLYSVYFQLGFNGETLSTNKAANTQELSAISGNAIQMNIRTNLGDNVWDSSEAFTHNNGTSLVNQFIYGSYSNNTTYPVAHPTRANTQIAVKSDTTNHVYAVEVAFPLSEGVKNSLKNNDIVFNLGVWENGNKEYVPSEGYDWGSGQVSVTLPKTVESTPIVAGVQSRASENEANAADIRFVAVMRENYEAYAKVGFRFTLDNYDGDPAVVESKYAYNELEAGNSTIDATNYGGQHFFTFAIYDLPAGTYTFTVDCYVLRAGEAAGNEIWSEDSITVTVTVDASGNATFQ